MDSVPPPSAPKDRPLTFVAGALWALLVLLLEGFIVGLTEAGRAGAYVDLVSRTACVALAYSVALFGILRVHEPEASIRHVLALQRPTVVALVLALVVGVALALPAEWLGELLEGRFPKPPEEAEAVDRLYSVATTGKRVALVVTVVFVQPALDELFFRGALFTPLRRTRRAESVVLATAAFEALLRSGAPRLVLLLLMASLVFAWMRAATGSVFPSMLARMAYMAVAAVPVVIGRDLPKPSGAWVAASAGVAAAALVTLGLLGRQASRRRDAGAEEAG